MRRDPRRGRPVNEKPSVLIITKDPSLAALAGVLNADRIFTESVETTADAEWFLRDHPTAVSVIDTELPLDVAFEAYELVHSAASRAAVILITPTSAPYFDRSGDGPTHDECIPRSSPVEQILLRLKALLILAGYDVPITPPGQRTPLVVAARAQRGKITVVFSAKGGVGKTTLAVNVAVGLARMGRKTVLVDANLYFGDASILLNVVSKRSLMDLADVYQVDVASVQQLMVPHESGLAVLSSPPEVERVEMLTADIVTGAIAASAAAFEHVIVDTHSSFDETNLQLLDLADRILLVTTPEVGATFNTSRFLSLANRLGYRDKITLILNRSESGIKPDAVERNLGTPVAATVISAGRRAVSAANRGVPLLLEDGRNEQRITRDLLQVAELIAGEEGGGAPAPASKRWPFARKVPLSSARST